MGDFTAVRSFTYVAGALIDPDENNVNENTIYSQHNLSMHGTTGHGHTGATGDGPALGSTAIDETDNYTWTGVHSFTEITAPLTVVDDTSAGSSATMANFYWRSPSPAVNDLNCLHWFQNSDTTTDAIEARVCMRATDVTHATRSSALGFYAMENGTVGEKVRVWPSGHVGINATSRLYFDGVGLGDTYIHESSANTLQVVSGATNVANFTTTRLEALSGIDFGVQATQKVFLDGFGDTSIRESAANTIAFEAGGNTFVTMTDTDALVVNQTTNNMCLDIDSSATTAHIIDITGDSLTSGSAINISSSSSNFRLLHVYSNATGSGPLVELNNDNPSSTGTVLEINQDGNQRAINVLADHGTGTNPSIAFDARTNSASNMYVMQVSGGNTGAGFTGGISLATFGTSVPVFHVPDDTTSPGTTYGRLAIEVLGVGVKYLEVKNA